MKYKIEDFPTHMQGQIAEKLGKEIKRANTSVNTSYLQNEGIKEQKGMIGRQVIKGQLPSKSNCYKIVTISGHGSLAKTKKLIDYENSFYMQCGLRDINITDYFKLKVDVYYTSLSSDIDNGMKILLDCLAKCKAIKNDNLCVELFARKFKDKDDPRIEFELIRA